MPVRRTMRKTRMRKSRRNLRKTRRFVGGSQEMPKYVSPLVVNEVRYK